MLEKFNFDEIRRNHPVDQVLRQFYPNNPIKHRKLCCPFHDDKTPSAQIFTHSGDGLPRFKCHVCDITYDGIQVAQRALNCNAVEAVRHLSGAPLPAEKPRIEAKPLPSRAPVFIPVPDGVEIPGPGVATKQFPTRDGGVLRSWTPSAVFHYHDGAGRLVGLVCRVEMKNGKKSYLPLRYERELGWMWAGWVHGEASPPLFNLPELLARPHDTVIVVEGEKCATIGKAVFPEYVFTTWVGGAKAVKNRDFLALEGRDVVFWPDHDEAGITGMRQVMARAKAARSRWVQPDPEWPAKTDIADLLDPSCFENAGPDLARAPIVNAEEVQAERTRAMTTVSERQLQAMEAVKAAEDWLPEGKRLFLRDNGTLDRKAEHNAVLLLQYHPAFKGRIAYDLFERRDMLDGEPLKHSMAYAMAQQMRKLEGIEITADNLYTMLKAFAQENRTNVFGDQVRALAETWDGKSRFISDYAGVEASEWSYVASRRWMIGLAKRVMQPGSKHDAILVLEGTQGTMKTSFWRDLGEVLGRNVTLEVQGITKDEELAKRMAGKAIWELSELHAMKGAAAELFKSMITRQEDRYREKYGRDFVDAPRAGAFAATTNDVGRYLMDPTGARRIWPLRVTGRADLEALRRDASQIWAEAAQRALDGEQNWLTPREEELHAEQVAARELEDPMVAMCERAIELIGSSGRMPAVQLFQTLGLDAGRLGDMRVRKSLHDAMAKLGWNYSSVRVKDETGKSTVVRGWILCGAR